MRAGGIGLPQVGRVSFFKITTRAKLESAPQAEGNLVRRRLRTQIQASRRNKAQHVREWARCRLVARSDVDAISL